jgi:hypothetical protein
LGDEEPPVPKPVDAALEGCAGPARSVRRNVVAQLAQLLDGQSDRTHHPIMVDRLADHDRVCLDSPRPGVQGGVMTENNSEDYGSYSVDDEDQLQAEDTLNDRGVADVLDEGYSPPERWSAGEGFGTTADEALEGETLDQRLAQEEPEPDPYAEEAENVGGPEVGGERSGRLVAPDEGAHEDSEKDLVAEDIGIDGAGASAEEAAVHVVDDEEPFDDEEFED